MFRCLHEPRSRKRLLDNLKETRPEQASESLRNSSLSLSDRYICLTPDDFVLKKKKTVNGVDSYEDIKIRTTGLVPDAVANKKFKKVNSGDDQWVDVTNERFMLWMRAPLRSNFHTLWGIIDEDLDQGLYRIDITNGRRI